MGICWELEAMECSVGKMIFMVIFEHEFGGYIMINSTLRNSSAVEWPVVLPKVIDRLLKSLKPRSWNRCFHIQRQSYWRSVKGFKTIRKLNL